MENQIYTIMNTEGKFSDGNLYVKWKGVEFARTFTKLDLDLHLNHVYTKRKNNPYKDCKIITFSKTLEQTVDTYSALNGLVPEPPKAEDTTPVVSE